MLISSSMRVHLALAAMEMLSESIDTTSHNKLILMMSDAAFLIRCTGGS